MPFIIICVLVMLLLASCGEGGGPRPYFNVDTWDACEQGLFKIPFPSDLRIRDDTLALPCLRLRGGAGLVSVYLSAVTRSTHEWGLHHAVYFRFSAPVDISSWPEDATASVDGTGTAFIVNIDPSCKDYGRYIPVTWYYTDTYSGYLPPHTLALLPVAGAGYSPGCLHAAFVKSGIVTVSGEKFRQPGAVKDLLSGRCSSPVLCEGADAFVEYLKDAGISRGSILVFTTFRAGRPYEELEKAIDFLDARAYVPGVQDFSYTGVVTESYPSVVTGSFYLYEGHASVLTFQQGDPPYFDFARNSGAIFFDEWGDPVTAGRTNVRFIFAHPENASGSIPCVVYSHGTGGDAYTVLYNGVALNLTARGIGVLSFDAPLHGERMPYNIDPVYTFFNPLNLYAARDNIRETALEIAQFVRLAEHFKLDATFNPDGLTVSCNPSQIYFMGHSQGAITGVPYLGSDDHVKGAVLSGGGGVLLYSLIDKELPVPIAPMIEAVFGSTEDLTPYHFLLNLFQMFLERADPVTYAPRMLRERPETWRPLHLFVSEGMKDGYTPPRNAEALCGASGLPQVEPIASLVPLYQLQDEKRVQTSPAVFNVTIPSGDSVTAGFIQFPDYGHFALFDSPCGYSMWGVFFQSLASETPVIDTACLRQ